MKIQSAFTHYIKYVRLKPFDMNTPDGRAKERQRRLALTTITSFMAKFVMVFTSLISIRLTLDYLGKERFGMWSLLSSFTAMLVFADLGIGNGLLTMLSKANGSDDRENAAKYVSSSFFILLFLAVIFGAIFALVYPYVSWARVFNVNSDLAVAEAGPLITIFFFCFLLNMPLGIVQRIQMGYQEGFINNIWLIVGNVIALFFVLILIYLKAGLPALSLAFVGVPVLAQFFNGLILFYNHKTWLLPRWDLFSYSSAKNILQLGFLFFVIQTVNAIGFQSDEIVIAQFLGAEMVPEFAIPKKLFIIGITMLSMSLSPLWPAYGEALARGDVRWAGRMLQRSTLLSGIFGVLSALGLLVFAKPILEVWVGGVIAPTWMLLTGFACWLILRSILSPLIMFMNGVGAMEFQTVLSVIAMVFNVIISIVLVKKMGVAGPIWGSVLTVMFCLFIPQVLYINRLAKRVLVKQ